MDAHRGHVAARSSTQPSEALAHLGAPLRYGAETAAIVFPADVLRRAMVTADAGLFPILVRHADECLAKLPPFEDDVLGQVRRLVASVVGNTTITIEILKEHGLG